ASNRLPIRCGIFQDLPQPAGNILIWDQRMHLGSVHRLGETLWQHHDRHRVREEGLERPVGYKPKFVEQRALEYRAKAGVAEELQEFRRRYWIAHLDTEALDELWIGIGSVYAKLDGPVRAAAPVPAHQSQSTELIA